MNPVLKKVLSVVAGLVVGMIVIGLVEGLGHLFFPPPEGLDMSDMEVVAEYIKTAPILSLLWVILAWFIGAFAGGAVATMVNKDADRMPAYLVGGILTLSGILNIVMIPHPIWFWLGILVFLPAALAGRKVIVDRQGV